MPRPKTTHPPVPRPAAERQAALHKTLRRTFGLKHLREGQEQVITSVLDRRPTLAVMPTGAGKSLCYQLPALLLPGLTVVVSPLIALMKDQCDKLRERGVAAVQLNSAVATAELHAAEASIADGSARIVFTTPERLADADCLQLLAGRTVDLLVIDEAHCISQWGHDFRPAFLEIGTAVPLLGTPTILALTATASREVIDDIARQLDVADFNVVNTGLYRPNLRYVVEQVVRDEEKLARAVAIVQASEGTGLVYAATVKAAEAVHEALSSAGASASIYHGKLSARERREHQDAFMRGEARVMVATNAFGLGIDKPDTRFVLHYQMPSGLDAYYQEAGRAGRDGESATCTLLFLHGDKAVQQFFLAGKYPAKEDIAVLYTAMREPPPEGGAWTLDALQEAIGRPKSKLQVVLRLLRQQKVVHQDRQGRLTMKHSALDGSALAGLLEAYRGKRESDRAALEQMVFYGQTGYCRWKVLLAHFKENDGFTACGRCDNCARQAELLARAASASAREDAEEAAAGDGADGARDEASAPAAFATGDRVRIPRYGLGVVQASGGDGIRVVFPEGSTRVFLPAFVKPASRPSGARSRQQNLPQEAPASG